MSMIEKGSVIYGFAIDNLPITTRVNVGGARYMRKPNGLWTDVNPDNPTNYARKEFIHDSTQAVVEFIPYPVSNPSVDLPDAVLSSWRAQFMGSVRYGARDHGVGNTLVEEAFREIGLTGTDETINWQPGMGGARGAVYALRDLPEDSLVYSAKRLYRKGGAYFYEVAPTPSVKARSLTDHSWLVIRVGPDGDLAPIEMRMTDEERVHERQLRARAWQVGMRLKAQHGWCSSLESIMQAGGLSPADGQAPGLGRSEVASLPHGSLLFWQSRRDPSQWGVVVRDDAATNTSHTTHVFGTNQSNSRGTMVPFWMPGMTWEGIPSWEVPNLRATAEVFLGLPVGSVVTIASSYYRVDRINDTAALSWINTRSGARAFTSANRAQVHASYNSNNWGTVPGIVSVPYIPEDNR